MNSDYAWIGIAAFAGVFAKAANWTKPDGSIHWRKAVVELTTVPAIGFIAGGMATLANPNMDLSIAMMIGAFLGYLGPTAIEAAFNKWLNR